jgi:exopolyphosphatase/guanosine-5'-triphosphate,3'-diphosphate pyrophosphatase
MQAFKKIIDQNKVDKIKAIGTSALRSASNGVEVLARIMVDTGIDASIISGELEAEYIYEGVRYGLEMGSEKSLIIDIGGGSVEFIIANQDGIFWKTSLEIGAQRLLEKFQKHDPISSEEIEMLNTYFDEKLDPLFEALQVHPTPNLIGASGSFDTLSDIHCFRELIAKGDNDPETPLTLQSFYSIAEEIITKNRNQRMAIPGMIEMRVDMIVVSSCLIKYILSRNPFQRIRVSSYSLKEGVLASLTRTLSAAELSTPK